MSLLIHLYFLSADKAHTVGRYHLGSLAFGSFIIAVVQMVRIMLEYIDHKLKGSENRVAKFLIKSVPLVVVVVV